MLRRLCEKYGVQYCDCDLGEFAYNSFGDIVLYDNTPPPNPYLVKDNGIWQWVHKDFRDYFTAQYLIQKNIIVTDIRKYRRALIFYKYLNFPQFYEYYASDIVSKFKEYCATEFYGITDSLMEIRRGIMFNFKYFFLGKNGCTYSVSSMKETLDNLYLIYPEIFTTVSFNGDFNCGYFGVINNDSDCACNDREHFPLVNNVIVGWSGVNHILSLSLINKL